MDYIIHLLIMIILYIILSLSLNFISGFAGMVSLAHAAFFGVGAYTTAILSVNYNFPFLLALPIAIVISGLVAFIVSAVALRTVDDYFIICSLGIQIIMFSIMNNWMELTRGPLGIANIPPIQILGLEFEDKIPFLILCFIICGIVFLLLNSITSSSFGRLLKALDEDEIFVQSLGKNVYKAKIITFVLGSMLAAIPGVLYAHYISFIDPTSFTLDESIFILSIVIIGGIGNLWGSVLAAFILVLLPEFLRFMGFPSDITANVRQIIYGVALVILMFKYSKGFKKGIISKA